MTRGRRAGLIALGFVALLPVAAAGALALLADSDALKRRLTDAARRATGREMVVAGPVGFTWSLTPAVSLQGVSLANPPGMSRAAMATLARVEAQVALLPLLSRRVEIRGVTLVEPDILLERDAAGQPNWAFPRPEAPPSTTPAAAQSGPGMRLSVDAIRVRGGRVGWRLADGTVNVLIPELAAVAAGPGGPVALTGTLAVGGTALAVRGTTGPLAGGVEPWPVQLALTGAGVRAAAEGALAPAALALSAEAADLAALPPVLGRALPALRDVRLSARLTEAGLVDAKGQAGAFDAGAWAPGLRVTGISVAAPAMAQPVTLTAEGMAGVAPVTFAANAGSLAGLLGQGPLPVQMLLAAAGATLGAQGSVADLTGRGLDLAVSIQAPDLAALGAAAGLSLPPLRDVAFNAGVTMPEPGAVALRDMRLASPHGNVSGDIVLARLPRPSLHGALSSQRLDLDALAALPVRPAPPEPPPSGPPSAPANAPRTRLLSDAPLPFAALRRADADVRVAVDEAVWRGTPYRAVEGRILLQDGRLQADPLRARTPGGTLEGSLTADAAGAVSFRLQAPGLAAGPVLALFGAPANTAGRLDADVQARGAGASVRAIAATLDGFLGLAMVEGEVDNRWLASLLGDALRGMPVDLGGRSKVRCLALRLDAAAGQAAVRAMLLDATRLRVEGEGAVNLADETLDLRLRALVRLGGTSVGAPVHLAGPWQSPRPRVATGGGALVLGGAAGPDTCPAQLSAARGGRAGPMPEAPAPSSETPRSLQPADLLRSLLR